MTEIVPRHIPSPATSAHYGGLIKSAIYGSRHNPFDPARHWHEAAPSNLVHAPHPSMPIDVNSRPRDECRAPRHARIHKPDRGDKTHIGGPGPPPFETKNRLRFVMRHAVTDKIAVGQFHLRVNIALRRGLMQCVNAERIAACGEQK